MYQFMALLYNNFIKAKVEEAKISDNIINVIDYNVDYKFGAFTVEFVALSHSIPDPAAIVLKTDKGQILHMRRLEV